MERHSNNTWNLAITNSIFPHTPSIHVPHPTQDEYKPFISFWLTTVGVLGFVGNALMLYLTRQPKCDRQPNETIETLRKDLMYYFIFNLAISDAAGSLVGVPLLALEMWFKFTVTSDTSCRLVRFFQLLFPTATVYLLLAITVERWRSIVSPLFVLKQPFARKIICLCWIWSSAIIFLGLPSFKIQIWGLDKTHFTLVCKYSNSDEEQVVPKLLYLIFCLLACVAPCLAVVGLSIYITTLIFKDRSVPAGPMAAIINEYQKHRTTRIFLTVVATFVTPYFAYITYGVINVIGLLPQISYKTDLVLRGVWVSLVYSNVIINPVVIFVQMKSLRGRFRTLLACSNKVQGSSEPRNKESTRSAVTMPRVEIPLELMNQNELAFPTLCACQVHHKSCSRNSRKEFKGYKNFTHFINHQGLVVKHRLAVTVTRYEEN